MMSRIGARRAWLASLALLVTSCLPLAHIFAPVREDEDQPSPPRYLETESQDGAVDLYWNTTPEPRVYWYRTRPSPPKVVMVQMSERGPTAGFHTISFRSGGIEDSLRVGSLVNGRPYYFRLVFDAHLSSGELSNSPGSEGLYVSAPVVSTPGVSATPVDMLPAAVDRWGSSGIDWSSTGEIGFIR